MTNLEQRIVAALSDETVTAASLAELVAETETAIAGADAIAASEREKVMDPLVCSDPKTARAELEGAEIARGRLLTLQPRLQQRYHDVEEAEDRAEWRIDFAAAAEERNALANELRETYPAAVATLANVFARIADNDEALSRLHQSRPSGAKGHLLGAELTARNIAEFTRHCPPLARELRLPDCKQTNKMVWPPRQVPAAVLFSESLPTDHPRYGKDWFKYQQQDAERRKVEEQLRIEQEATAQEEHRRAFERTLPR